MVSCRISLQSLLFYAYALHDVDIPTLFDGDDNKHTTADGPYPQMMSP